MIAVMLFGLLLLLLITGMPIAVAMGSTAMIVLSIMVPNTNLTVVPQRLFTAIDSFSLTAVPFFILAGAIMEKGGISKRLVGFAKLLFSWLPAGLSCITIAASAFFGAISGSNPATVAAIGGIMVPEMTKSGYSKEDAATVVAAAGTLGVVIPPSIPMVTYAIMASVSVGTLFVSGFVPGILLALVLMVISIVKYGKTELRVHERISIRQFFSTLLDAMWAIIMPVIILGGIYGGFFTPTESAAVACVYAFIVSKFIYRELDVLSIRDLFKDAAINTSAILFLVSFAAPFSWLMASQGVTQMIADAVLSFFSHRISILLVMNLMLLFLGLFLDTLSIVLLVTPILLPIATQIQLDPIVLGLIIVVNTSIGMITPPMAMNMFVAGRISNTPIEAMSRRIIPFLLGELAVLLVMTYVPDVVLFLPQVLGMIA